MTQFMKKSLVFLGSLSMLALPVTALSATIDLSTQPIANVAKPALSTSNLSISGGNLFDVRFTVKDPALGETGYDVNNFNQYNIFSGDLRANAVNTNGVITSLKWQARVKLETQNWDTGRNIFTSEGSSGIKFRWADLSAALKALVDPTAAAASPVPATSTILNWVRGSHANETVNGGTLRTRQITVSGTTSSYSLGDIIHSSPVYVGPPTESYTFAGYAAFRSAKVNRKPMVYVGANDGMLHAFIATVDQTDSGKEVFAYIPKTVLGNLNKLTNTNYINNHVYFVDGSPTAGDVCFNTCAGVSDWRTVLVGGLNGGGKSIYALDITNPAADVTDESTAASKFLWEFTDSTDLGYTFSKPIIARLTDGTWVAIFGNGYNSTGDKAVLFVVNVQTGALIQKIVTPGTGTPNGLSSPTALDTNADNVVDFVYAGDLQGNLWKFNFTAATNSGGVTFSYTSGGTSQPLIKVAQPITTPPKVAVNTQDGGYLVAFGTGRLLEDGDKTSTTTNYMYGIFDRTGLTPTAGWGGSPSLKSSTVSTNLIDTTYLRFIATTTTPGGSLAGWKLQLPTNTERVVNEPIIRSGRVVFTTVDPGTNFNRNWRMAIDYLTGTAPTLPFFDTNGDGKIDITDKVDHDDDDGASTETLVPVGQDEALGVVSAPVAARIANDLDVIYVTHALDAIISSNPFNDPGLAGGHFDVDNFNGSNAGDGFPVSSCTTTPPSHDKSADKCHVHQFDDQYNVTGINLLKSVNTYDKAGALKGTGLISSGLREPDHTVYGLCNKRVTISLVNPNRVQTTDPVTGGEVEPGRIKMKHGAVVIDTYTEAYTKSGVSYTAFNALPEADRTMKVCDLKQLEINFTNINALRATEPSAAQNKDNKCPNSPKGYRDGALVIRVASAVGESDAGKVLHETALYEHLKKDTLLAANQAAAQIGCGLDGEASRQYKDPTKFAGSSAGSSGSGTGSGVTVGGGGTGVGFTGSAGTGLGVYTGTDLGRHNWRELITY